MDSAAAARGFSLSAIRGGRRYRSVGRPKALVVAVRRRLPV